MVLVTREYRKKRRIETWEEFTNRVYDTNSHEELVGLYKVGWRFPCSQQELIRVYTLALNTGSMAVIKAAAEGIIAWSRTNKFSPHYYRNHRSFSESMVALFKLLNSAAKWLRAPYTTYLVEFCQRALEAIRQDGALGDYSDFFQRDLFSLIIRLNRFDLLIGQGVLALEAITTEWLWVGHVDANRVTKDDLKGWLSLPEKRKAALAYLEIAFVEDCLPEI